MASPAVLALDFDGVLCDGMREYVASSWRAWTALAARGDAPPPADLVERFARLRPLVESGWEMVAIVHALMAGAAEPALERDWRPEAWLADLGTSRAGAAGALDAARDAWIARDLGGWLDHHRFYPGVLERLRALATPPPAVYVVTTKEGRVARALLARGGVSLPEAAVIGKEARRPKPEILVTLAARHAAGDARGVWFVEDRLRTLEAATAHAPLAGARLFLAAWGYNTPAERDAARRDARIALLTLDAFTRDLATWPAPRVA